jgi:hypothetical protein
MSKYTSLGLLKTTKDKINKDKARLKLSSYDELLNTWEAKERLYDQTNPLNS